MKCLEEANLWNHKVAEWLIGLEVGEERRWRRAANGTGSPSGVREIF